MDRITDQLPEKTLNDALDLISLEQLADLELTPQKDSSYDTEKLTVDLAIFMNKFSNIDIHRRIEALFKEYKESKDLLQFQWNAAEELSDLGIQHIKKVIRAIEKENLSDPIRAIPSIAAAFVFYNRMQERQDDVAIVNMKNDLLAAIEILAGNGRALEALEILNEIDIPSILREGKICFLEATVLLGNPVVAGKILEKIDPDVQLLILRGGVISRLVKEGEYDLAISLAKGRDEKGKIPSTYFNIPVGYLQQGKTKKAVSIAEELFPEDELLIQFCFLALNWSKDSNNIDEFEKLLKLLSNRSVQNRLYVTLYSHFQEKGAAGRAEPYANKIDFDLLLKTSPIKVSPRVLSKLLGKTHPNLQKMAETHFGI